MRVTDDFVKLVGLNAAASLETGASLFATGEE